MYMHLKLSSLVRFASLPNAACIQPFERELTLTLPCERSGSGVKRKRGAPDAKKVQIPNANVRNELRGVDEVRKQRQKRVMKPQMGKGKGRGNGKPGFSKGSGKPGFSKGKGKGGGFKGRKGKGK